MQYAQAWLIQQANFSQHIVHLKLHIYVECTSMQRHSGDATTYRSSAVSWHGQPRCYEGTGGTEAAVVTVNHIAEIRQHAAAAHLPVETRHGSQMYVSVYTLNIADLLHSISATVNI